MLTIIRAALEAGFLYAPVAMALFLSFSILNIADMTTDGAFVLGSAVSAMMCLSGHPVLALPAGMLAAAAAGGLAAFLSRKFYIHYLMLGAPLAARQVGWAMRRCPDELPWQRVIREDGTIAGGEYAPLRRAMLEAKRLGKLIVAHCEDNSLLRGGYIHDGAYARAHGHRGICSESEWRPIQRDLELVRETGCGYHVCHISTKESVALIRKAKAEGLNVTCETGPHYLLLDDSCLQEDGRFKMNPPLRDKADREALLEGLADWKRPSRCSIRIW